MPPDSVAESFIITPPPSPPSELTRARELRALPPDSTFLRILGVDYVHLRLDQGELYITEHGLPFVEHLRPENWYERDWFNQHRERLEGSGTVYRLPTRPIASARPPQPRSIDLVVKWSRVGQDIPPSTLTLTEAINAEFNSPFEEFSLLEELRTGTHGPRQIKIRAQKPLAIYVPPEHMQLWQSGRSRERIMRKIARHAGIEIDILRSYILLFGWIKGFSAPEAYHRSYIDFHSQRRELAELTQRVENELRLKGFTVTDHKPAHCIVRMRGGLIRQRRGKTLYAIIDYELLARTPEHEEQVKAALRQRYLLLQRDRFKPRAQTHWPGHLKPARIMDVDYVYGRAESTGGLLWVVGRDPDLFGYFLPERWRSKQIQLSPSGRAWYTQTKDRIHLVWKVSRVGDLPVPPGGDLADPAVRPLLRHGYNSPFEEFALALRMAAAGLKVIYPRAIYVTGSGENSSRSVLDSRRFEQSDGLLSPDGQPVLPTGPDYVSVWGYWRGLEDDQAPEDAGYWVPIDAQTACERALITPAQAREIVQRQRASLAAAGFEDVNLKPDHILLSHIAGGNIKRDADGQVELRHCNLEMVREVRWGQCLNDSLNFSP